jgi:hypothetical protein
MIKPGGTVNPALTSSMRFKALPPTLSMEAASWPDSDMIPLDVGFTVLELSFLFIVRSSIEITYLPFILIIAVKNTTPEL